MTDDCVPVLFLVWALFALFISFPDLEMNQEAPNGQSDDDAEIGNTLKTGTLDSRAGVRSLRRAGCS